jgi:hypothetical protein
MKKVPKEFRRASLVTTMADVAQGGSDQLICLICVRFRRRGDLEGSKNPFSVTSMMDYDVMGR